MKLLSRIVAYTLAFVVSISLLLLLGLWLLSPAITRPLLGGVLEEHGLVLDSQSSVRLNPFSSKLRIKKLAWRASEDTLFNLDELFVSYSLIDLFSSKVYISEIKVVGVDAKLSQENEDLNIVGFSLASEEQADPAQQVSEPSPSASESADTDAHSVHVELLKTSFEDIRIEFSRDGQVQELLIDSLVLDELVFENQVLQAKIAAQLQVNKDLFSEPRDPAVSSGMPLPELALEFAFESSLEARLGEIIELKLSDLLLGFNQLQFRDPTYDIQLEQMTLGLAQTELRLGETVKVDLSALNFGLKALNFRDSDYAAYLKSLEFSSAQSSLALNEADAGDSEASIESVGEFDLQLAALKLSTLGGDTIAALDEFTVPSLKFELSSGLAKAELATLELNGAQFLALEAADSKFAGFSSLVLNQLQFEHELSTAKSSLKLASLLLGGLAADVAVDANGEIAALNILSTETEEAPEASESAGESASPGPSADSLESEASNQNLSDEESSALLFEVAKVELISPAEIKFKDLSVNPQFNKQFMVEKFQLSNINNFGEDEVLEFFLTLKDEAYFNYELSGSAQPFKEKLNLKLDTKAAEFSVNEVSPYLYSALGFGVEAGQLDSDVSLSVTDDILDGKVKLNLRGAKFSSNKTKQDDELDMVGQAAIPLNVALGMLKDGDGNIKLTIPVDGDVNDPSFGVQYIVGLVVKKAVMSQTKKHLINTFIPYGQVLSVAYSAGSYALKVRFEDLIYEPRQEELGDSQLAFVEQFTALLEKKKNLQVRVCPVAVPSEFEGKDENKTLDDAQKQTLLELAKARGTALKKAATAKGIDSARLLICSPELDLAKDAKPRIEFSI